MAFRCCPRHRMHGRYQNTRFMGPYVPCHGMTRVPPTGSVAFAIDAPFLLNKVHQHYCPSKYHTCRHPTAPLETFLPCLEYASMHTPLRLKLHAGECQGHGWWFCLEECRTQRFEWPTSWEPYMWHLDREQGLVLGWEPAVHGLCCLPPGMQQLEGATRIGSFDLRSGRARYIKLLHQKKG